MRFPIKTFLPWFFLLLFLTSPEALAGTSGASSIATQFISETASWYSEIKTVAQEIFYALFGIDFVYLVAQWLIGGKDVHEIFTSFIKKLMTIGFFYFLLMNGHAIVWDVIDGFKGTATAAAGAAHMGLKSILSTGFKIFKTCVEGPMVTTKGGTLEFAWHLITSDGKTLLSTIVGMLVGIIVGLIAILALIYLALEYLAIQVEAAMVASIGVIMLGFSGSRWTVQHAEGYLKYALSVGVRFLVLMIWVAFIEGSTNTLLPNLLNGVKHTGGTNIGTTIDAYGNILIFALLIAWLTKKLPSLAASIVSGNSSLSGGAEGAALLAGAAVAAAAVATGGIAAAGGVGAAAGGGAGGVMTGAQAAGLAGSGGGAAAGSLPGAGGMGSAAGGAFPGAEHAVQAPDPSTIRSMREDHAVQAPVVGGGSQGAAPRATPTAAPASSSAGKSAGGATGGSGSGAGGSGSVDSAEGGADSGAATGAESSAEAGGGSAGSTGADAVEADAGGAAAETPAEAVDAGAGQGATQTASGAPQQKRPLPSATEAQANLVQAFHEALRPMNETMQKVNDTMAAGQQEKPKDFSERLSDWQKRHHLAESLLSPGKAEGASVQAANHGLKHSE